MRYLFLFFFLLLSGCATLHQPFDLDEEDAAFDDAVETSIATEQDDGGFCNEVEEEYGKVEGCSLDYTPVNAKPTLSKVKMPSASSFANAPAPQYVAELDCDIFSKAEESGKPVGQINYGVHYKIKPAKQKGWSTLGIKKFVKTECFAEEDVYVEQ